MLVFRFLIRLRTLILFTEGEMLLNICKSGNETVVLLESSGRPAFTAEGWENPMKWQEGRVSSL